MNQSPHSGKIATSSVEEGLDFACHLISSALCAQGDSHPDQAQKLLRELTSYITYRYVGELLLALECLVGAGHSSKVDGSKRDQFWLQLRWIAAEMRLSHNELSALELPNE